jgi:hypothetical protein
LWKFVGDTSNPLVLKQLQPVKRDFLLSHTAIPLYSQKTSFLSQYRFRHLKNGKRQAGSYEGASPLSTWRHNENF